MGLLYVLATVIPMKVSYVSVVFFLILLEDKQKLGVGVFVGIIYDIILYLYLLSFGSFNNVVFQIFTCFICFPW